MNSPDQSSLEQALLAWAGDVVGGTVSTAHALVGGNRRRAWAVDVTRPDGQILALFLRFASSDSRPTADPYTLRREASVYRALADTPVAIARVYGTHPTHEAMLLERIEGDTAYRAIGDETQRRAVAEACVHELHRLHALDARTLDLPLIGPVVDIATAVRRELTIWRGMYAEAGRGDPLIELALGWLETNVPAVDEPAVLVHGDAGPGNFMFDGHRMAALIDWELAHLGDPVEDWAWLSMRCTLEPFPDFAAQLRLYEQLRGHRIDRMRLAYHRVFVALRVVVIRHRALGDAGDDSDLANSLVSRHVNRHLLVDGLGRVMGLGWPEVRIPPRKVTPRAPYHDYALTQLRHVIVPGSTDPMVIARAKGVARVLNWLKEVDARGAACEADEGTDLAALLGQPAPDIEAAREVLSVAIRDGAVDKAQAWAYLARQDVRDRALASAALGALATRGFPDIDD